MIIEGFEFDTAKSSKLRQERGLGFEEIITAIESGQVVDIYDHPNQKAYRGQKIYEVNLCGYVWRLPHLRQKNTVRLITGYPCRKATKKLS